MFWLLLVVVAMMLMMDLSVTNRFDPECEPHLDEVLNQESIHSS